MRGALHQAVKGLAAGYDVVRRPRAGITILIYHRVGGPGGSVDLDPARFEDQMAELAASGRVRTLDDALADPGPVHEGRPGPVVITFDDGTADFAEHAVVSLVRHRVPALLYLATRFVDEGVDFPGGGPAISWSALRDVCSTGVVEIGSHTHSHVLLDRLPPAEVADELDRSIELIAEELGRAPVHFAYPKALLGSAAARAEVERRFRTAAIGGMRTNVAGQIDPYRLARSPIQVADGMRWFRRKASGGMVLEDRLRTAANRVRYAGASS